MKTLCKYDKLVSVNELKPNPNNPNKHSPEQIERLSKLLDYYGWRHPIIVSKQSGLIVVGHGRWQAAKYLKQDLVPIVYQDFETPDIEYAFMVADNGIGEWSDLDFAMINENIGQLGPDFEIDLLGLKDFEIDVADRILVPEAPGDKKENNKNVCPECGFEW